MRRSFAAAIALLTSVVPILGQTPTSVPVLIEVEVGEVDVATIVVAGINCEGTSAAVIYDGKGVLQLRPVLRDCDTMALTVRSLGFRTVYDTVVAENLLRLGARYDVVLVADTSFLADAIVVGQRRRDRRLDRPDTTRYDADSLKQHPADRAADLIERLPDAQVDPATGRVRVDGRAVDAVLFDGEDVSGVEYGRVVGSLSAAEIETVEVIRDWKRNPRLGFFEPSDQVAINLRLVDSPLRIGGTAEAGLGAREGPEALGSVEPFAHQLRGRARGVVHVGYDNTGADIRARTLDATELTRERDLWRLNPIIPAGDLRERWLTADAGGRLLGRERGARAQGLFLLGDAVRVRSAIQASDGINVVDVSEERVFALAQAESRISTAVVGELARTEYTGQLEVDAWLTTRDYMFASARLGREHFEQEGSVLAGLLPGGRTTSRGDYLAPQADFVLEYAHLRSDSVAYRLNARAYRVRESTDLFTEGFRQNLQRKTDGALLEGSRMWGASRSRHFAGVRYRRLEADGEVDARGTEPHYQTAFAQVTIAGGTAMSFGPYYRFVLRNRRYQVSGEIEPALVSIGPLGPSDRERDARVAMLGSGRFSTYLTAALRLTAVVQRELSPPPGLGLRGVTYFPNSVVGYRFAESSEMVVTEGARLRLDLTLRRSRRLTFDLDAERTPRSYLDVLAVSDTLAGVLTQVLTPTPTTTRRLEIRYQTRWKSAQTTITPIISASRRKAAVSVDQGGDGALTNLQFGLSATTMRGRWSFLPQITYDYSGVRAKDLDNSFETVSGTVRLRYRLKTALRFGVDYRTRKVRQLSAPAIQILALAVDYSPDKRLHFSVKFDNLIGRDNFAAVESPEGLLSVASTQRIAGRQAFLRVRYDF